ncbi:MAG TPA: GNAT family N-acetyltransferase [Bacteroidetes bacterium]|nr:GNAT family N-acetyltransferase [Bacteroidota bacterium]
MENSLQQKSDKIRYEWYEFQQLSPGLLYEILALRQEVFVVEQNCPYMDIDGLDRQAWHLLGRNAEGNLVAYLRIVAPGAKYREPAIGRVFTHKSIRGKGIGRELMIRGIKKAEELFPGSAIRLSAQVYAQGFYAQFGFSAVGEPYDEDGIPHVEMVKIP